MRKTSISKLAQVALKYAIDSGKLSKPKKCKKCGKAHKTIHGHHEDYDKPLEVIWLCPSCHAVAHGRGPRGRKENPEKNPKPIPLMAPKTSLALRFQQERLSLFATHKEAAEALGVTAGAVCHWERGIRPVPEIVWLFLNCLKKKRQMTGIYSR